MEHARPPTELCLEGSSVSRADAWRRWRSQFMLFLKASGVQKEGADIQASLIINLIGPEGFEVFETFSFDKESDKDDVNLLLKKFDEYFGVKQNITLARYNFFTRGQELGESIDQYVTALRLLTKNCNFKNLEEELIRDRIVCGIQSTAARDRLLRVEDLTLEKAIKIVQVDQISIDNRRLLETHGAGTSGLVQVDAVGVRGVGGRGGRGSWRGSGRRQGHGVASVAAGSNTARRLVHSSEMGKCLRCGGQCNEPSLCPAISVQCYLCENRGHFARMCKLKKVVKKMYDIGLTEAKGNEEDDCESFFVSVLYPVSEINSSSEDWFETLQGECGSEKIKLDTGADINVLSYRRFLLLGYDSKVVSSKVLDYNLIVVNW